MFQAGRRHWGGASLDTRSRRNYVGSGKRSRVCREGAQAGAGERGRLRQEVVQEGS